MSHVLDTRVDQLLRLDGKVAVVTGASSGLGARFARVMHAAGCTLVVAARRQNRLEELARSLGGNVLTVRCDVTIDDDLERLVDVAVESGGGLDVVVNNAGTSAPGRAEHQDAQRFREAISVNLTAAFILASRAAKFMLEQRSGSIVNVASMYGLVASTPVRDAAYAASKGGLVNLTRELAAQWARQGVRVNALAPGWFPTEMNADMWQDEASTRWVRRTAPMGRPGREHELDAALLYLASDASSYMTGQVLTVDGGWTSV